MKCPNCNSRLECSDSRHHELNTVKRRRQCMNRACGYTTNSIEVLLPEELNGTRTGGIAHRMIQAAAGNAEADRVAGMLRQLADSLEGEV